MLAICSNNSSHKKFVTVAHEMHDWEVDEKGDFVKDLGCVQTTHGPNKDNIWTCAICGAEAIVDD